MIQNIIALTIVFLAVGYTIYAIIKSLTVKKSSQCGSCESCIFKEQYYLNKTSETVGQLVDKNRKG